MQPSILVFVVEDEPLILDLIEEALIEGGFAVEKANIAEEAISLLDQKGADYRAVVTDIKIGSSTVLGWDVARHARKIDADVPIVYMTGDSGHDWAANGVPNSILIQKPFAPAQIVTAVSQLINAQTPGLTGAGQVGTP